MSSNFPLNVFSKFNHQKKVKEYSPIDGQAPNKELTQALIFGNNAPIVSSGRIASAQALSGTGSLRVAGDFIKTYLPDSKAIYLPDPSWGNHKAIFTKAGLEVKTYPYWDAEQKNLNFAGMLQGIQSAPRGSIILLHSVAHNPTGIDPTTDQWKQVVEACKRGGLIPMIDNAYQGFASGCLDKDAAATRMFGDSGMEFFICQSFAKNMGLYGERVGMLHVVCSDKDIAAKVLSQLKLVIRPMYSSPPIHGAQLVNRILGDATLRSKWAGEVKGMADRINDMRGKLRSAIEKMGTPGQWNHITDQIGMFSFTGLSKNQCELLIDKWHIYLLKNGRISMAGVRTKIIIKFKISKRKLSIKQNVY